MEAKDALATMWKVHESVGFGISRDPREVKHATSQPEIDPGLEDNEAYPSLRK